MWLVVALRCSMGCGHRVKSISMGKFLPEEVAALENGGNAVSRSTRPFRCSPPARLHRAFMARTLGQGMCCLLHSGPSPAQARGLWVQRGRGHLPGPAHSLEGDPLLSRSGAHAIMA